MNNHPISDLFQISMDSLKSMIDVDTVVGEMIKVSDEVAIIPISKVKCAYATGGTDQNKAKQESGGYPFGGATGGTITITPIAFLSIVCGEVRLLHLEDQTHLYERIIDQVPEAIASIKDLFTKKSSVKELEVIEKK